MRDLGAVDVDDFGFGLMTKLSPTEQPFGAALASFDCDYNTRNVRSRKGYAPILENGPGAIKIADFESGEAWSGGNADMVNFVLTEAAADGTRGRSLSVTATGGGATVSMSLVTALDMGTDPLDVIHLWASVLSLPSTITSYYAELIFETSPGNQYTALFLSSADFISGDFTAKNGMTVVEEGIARYSRRRRLDFDQLKIGSPDWTNITKIYVQIFAKGSGVFTVVFDNLHRTPGLMQDLFQFRRETGAFAGAVSFYAVTNGTLYQSSGKRWVSVFSGFDAHANVYSLSAQDRRIITDGITSPRVLMSDGTTVYRLGIVTPPKQMTAGTVYGTGALPDGDYFAQLLYYSSITGEFSAPDDRVPKLPIITIAGGAGLAGIRFSNLPVSADPQVTHIVIGIRPSTEPSLFFRASDGLYGEVTNGTTTFDFLDNLATLLARSLTAVDPDLDYPSVVDPTTGQPIEAHPTFLAEAGGYILTVMAEQPTVVRVSRFREVGAWALDDEFPLGENDNEPVTGLTVVASHIIAGKRDAIYPGRVVGGDDKIVFDPPISDRGPLSHKGMYVVGSVLFYRGMDGIYALAPNAIPTKISDLAQPTWKELWDPYSVGHEAAVPVRDTEHVVFFGRSLGSLRNDVGWVTHYRTVRTTGAGRKGKDFPLWAPTLWRMPADVASEVRPQGGDGTGWESWIGGLGQVFRIGYGQQDDGRPITARHQTALITPKAALAHLFRFVELEMLCSGQFNLKVAVYLGTAIVPDASVSIPLQGNAAVLGSFVLGTSLMGTPRYVSQRISLPIRAARYISLDLSITSRAEVEVYRLRPRFSPLGSRRVAA
jgi:hypothetical protein